VHQLTWAARVNCSAKKNSASTPGPELNEQQALMILAGSEWLTTLGCGEDQ